MYEGPLQTNVKSVKTSILVLKVTQGHYCFWCQWKPVYDFLLSDSTLSGYGVVMVAKCARLS